MRRLSGNFKPEVDWIQTVVVVRMNVQQPARRGPAGSKEICILDRQHQHASDQGTLHHAKSASQRGKWEESVLVHESSLSASRGQASGKGEMEAFPQTQALMSPASRGELTE